MIDRIGFPFLFRLKKYTVSSIHRLNVGKTNADYGEDEPPSGTRLRSYLVSNVKILDYFLPYCYLFGGGSESELRGISSQLESF